MKSLKKLCANTNKFSNSNINSVVILVEPEEAAAWKNSACLCEIIRLILVFGRYTGLLPIIPQKSKMHLKSCELVVSKRWIFYTGIILVLYVPYVFFMYAERFICGPNSSSLKNLEWYVMTFGYVITDIESIISLLVACVVSKKLCIFLQHLSQIPGPPDEMVILHRGITKFIKYVYPFGILVFLSYTYVAWLRLNLNFGNYYCTLLDQPFAVIIRGITLIFPTTQITIITTFVILIVIKFNSLTEATTLALQACSTTGNALPLESIERIHLDLSQNIKELNDTFGIQILLGITSSLYTTIYYLYRMCTATDSNKYTISNVHEDVHYFVSFIYRSSKLVAFTVLGHTLSTSSQKPLEILLAKSILPLPHDIQKQIKTLILVWQNKKPTLSALGVVNIGPWLLAPIIGNIITYLLVALQFKTNDNYDSFNITTFLETEF